MVEDRAGVMRVLVRAVGPGLTTLGVTGAMLDPRLTFYEESTPIASNDDWDPVEVGEAILLTGAFPLETGSRDAALVATIETGKSYAAQVRSDDQGIVLIEVYDVPNE